ncbi:MAG: SGNH/GDSL hydrolase family protein, partial [Acidimicrobiia bacterium]
GWLAVRLGALPGEGGEGQRVKLAVVAWTALLAVALVGSRARRLVAATLVALGLMLAAGEALVRVAAPQEREEARWADLASRFPEAPTPVAAPVILMDRDRRRTTDAPLEPDRRVVLFGGSTTFAAAVGDRDTWASVLQRRLNAEGLSVRVDNFGVQGAAIMHMAPWVERELGVTIRRGDVVVIYAGVNEAKNAVLFRGNVVDRLRRRYGRLDDVVAWLSRRSDMAYLVERTLNTGAPVIEESSFSLTADGLSRIEEMTKLVGARLVVVLQPHAFTRARATSYERAIRESMTQFPGAIDTVYPRIADTLLAVPGAIDGRAIFDTFDGSPYLDWCHVGVEGNRAIGDWLADRLLPILATGG